jgi:molybdate-binding protein
LAFVPLTRECVDLAILGAAAGSREIRGLFKVLASRWLIDQLADLPGYDPSHCGERAPVFGPRA